MSRHSPPVSTPLEPCRVAPYVNLPSLRASNSASSNTQRQFNSSAAAVAAAAAFSAFDPALLTAAHQVMSICLLFCLPKKKLREMKFVSGVI